MKNHSPESPIKTYAYLTIGTLLLAVGNYFFKFPNHFSFGGVTGIATVLSGVLPVSSSTLTTIFNLTSLVLGFLFLDKEFGIKTIYVTLLFSGFLQLFQWLLPLTHPLTNEPVLELLFAIVLPASAAAIFFNHSASSGGTDIIAMILKRYSGLDIGAALILADCLVVVSAFGLYGVNTGLFSLIGLFAKSVVMNSAITDMNLNKYFTVICDEPEPILQYIREDINRGATLYKAEGAYSQSEKTVILSVMSRMQAQKLRRYIHDEHPNAFVMITNSSEIDGKGFHSFY